MTNSPYQKLLTATRSRPTTVPSGSSIVEASASDRSRVIYSAPFRRLQQKAQVFSLESNASVRSRLTHSLEVADVGRRIAQKVVNKLYQDRLIGMEESAPFVTIVETACLMHDIGNPPFGHFGEAAIQEWAETLPTRRPGLGEKIQALKSLSQFDGNPQGVRVVCRLQSDPLEMGKQPTEGLNLTYTQLLASLKYLRVAGQDHSSGFLKKPGFFESERSTIEKAWKAMEYDPEKPRRHPLVFIVEAADDIAYCMSDLEDGVENGLVSKDQVLKSMLALPRLSNPGKELTFLGAKIKYASTMIDRAATQYLKQHEDIIAGKLDQAILDIDQEDKETLKGLKKFARAYLFNTEAIEFTELSGFAVVRGLLSRFEGLLELERDKFQLLLDARSNQGDWRGKGLDTAKRLVGRLPEKHVAAYHACVKEGIPEIDCRAHLIVDYVAGMTDNFALETHRTLSGIQKHR